MAVAATCTNSACGSIRDWWVGGVRGGGGVKGGGSEGWLGGGGGCWKTPGEYATECNPFRALPCANMHVWRGLWACIMLFILVHPAHTHYHIPLCCLQHSTKGGRESPLHARGEAGGWGREAGSTHRWGWPRLNVQAHGSIPPSHTHTRTHTHTHTHTHTAQCYRWLNATVWDR